MYVTIHKTTKSISGPCNECSIYPEEDYLVYSIKLGNTTHDYFELRYCERHIGDFRELFMGAFSEHEREIKDRRQIKDGALVKLAQAIIDEQTMN